MEAAWQEVVARVRPGPALLDATTAERTVWLALALGAALVVVPGVWRLVRVAVTVVHELGHAVVGMAVGRSFTGLVLRPDMSGHTVTVGPARGPGRVVTTWAGYPAPALVGAGLLHAGTAGWAPPVLAALLVLLAVGALRVRSFYTALVVLGCLAGAAVLWWVGSPTLQGLVLVAAGVMLVLGAWRHLGAVLGSPDRGSDPAVLAQLTRVPTAVWTTTFVLALGAASWVAARAVLPLLG
ncbi:M50 family metallopeptidase [Georgenia faecalis]|uniref:M50 family metallopeptidase n=1 Tax=Georgenia faecalis TaxID=2483799 RepID=A0ABV9D8D2_9MICO|nr:M50 family metallopeptidase [Georgenia faecalis]